MLPARILSIAEQLAKHDAEIQAILREQEAASGEMRNLKNWIMSTLVAVLVGLGVQLIRMLSH